MIEFDMIQCGLMVLVLMVVGETLSHKMKAVLPSILVSSVLFLILIWSGIIPATLIEDSGLLEIAPVAMMFIIIGMGISTKPKELLENWKVVALAASTYIGQTLILLFVISKLFDKTFAIGGLPGGAAVALIVQEHARALGLNQIVVFSVLLVSVQGLVACPLASWMIRKEVKRYKTEELPYMEASVQQENSSDNTDDQKRSPYKSILRFFIVAWIASRLEIGTGISKYVFCLILGVILSQIGFFSQNEMDNSKSHGLLSLMMMASVINGFSGATIEMFLDLMKPLVCVLFVDVVSIFILSRLLGKYFGFSKPMSFAISLNVMIGFPLNLMLAEDIIHFMGESPDEIKILNQKISSKMVIAGFTSVTFLSTIGAGILVKLL